MRNKVFFFLLVCCLLLPALTMAEEIGTGQLLIVSQEKKDVEVPLAHTSVKADVAGYVSRVTVTQTFVNPFKEPIEAIYVFPLPHRAAVDAMTMKIGQRIVKGVIKTRQEAKETYEKAKREGKTASLLEQERPNIFTQSVANILPGDNIEIEISYVDVLQYENGEFEFVFPMVVGPRYIPGEKIIGKQAGGWAPDTDRVPDASRITPPVLKPNERSGHDIDVTVNVDAGVPFDAPTSPSHWINVKRDKPTRATVTLDERDTIPNKDLILRYRVAGQAPHFGSVVYSEGNEGYFLLLLAPKAQYAKGEILPREILFVVDSSGSQQGDPLTKSKELVKRALKSLRAEDTFQVFNFNDIVTSMAPGPVPATAANINEARKFIDQIRATGGTRMLPVIQTALNWPADPKRLRMVVMTTDGYIGNETEILKEINDNLGDARLFMFGVGSSTNRYLIDRMAEQGKGFAQFVRQDEATDRVVETFHRRMESPVLRDVALDWGGLAVTDVYPERIPDLYADQPLAVFGRFTKPGSGTVKLAGGDKGGKKQFSVRLDFPGKKSGSDQIATLWVRTRIEKLMNRIEVGSGDGSALEKEVTDLGLKYALMTNYTSFVAVEEQVRNVDGVLKTVQVPVEMPEGVSYEGVFGEEKMDMLVGGSAKMKSAAPMMSRPAPAPPRGGSGSISIAPLSAVSADEDYSTAPAARLSIDPVAFLGISNEGPYRETLFNKALKKLDEALKGLNLPSGKTMMVRVTLKASGEVTKVEILKDETGRAQIGQKIIQTLKQVQFPAPGGEASLVFFVRF